MPRPSNYPIEAGAPGGLGVKRINLAITEAKAVNLNYVTQDFFLVEKCFRLDRSSNGGYML